MQQLQLTGDQFQQIGKSMFGQDWRKEMGAQLELSYARVSQLATADLLSEKSSQKVIQLHTAWKSGGEVPVGLVADAVIYTQPVDDEASLTDEQILDRINKRFTVMDRMVAGMINGVVRSLIVAGVPGIGKTYNLEQMVKKAHREQALEYTIIRGTCSAVGLYQALYNARGGGVVVLDDCDSIFNDEQAFNILKSALDSTNVRTIAWRKQSSWVYDANSEDAGALEAIGERFPNEFDFEGGVVFITNLDFRGLADKGNRLSPHFNALLSRSMYLDLTLQSIRARVLRIKDVFLRTMYKEIGITVDEAGEILEYVLENADRIGELSLRTVKHITDIYRLGSDWKEIVEVTKMREPK